MNSACKCVSVFWITGYYQSVFQIGADRLHKPCLYPVYDPNSVVS